MQLKLLYGIWVDRLYSYSSSKFISTNSKLEIKIITESVHANLVLQTDRQTDGFSALHIRQSIYKNVWNVWCWIYQFFVQLITLSLNFILKSLQLIMQVRKSGDTKPFPNVSLFCLISLATAEDLSLGSPHPDTLLWKALMLILTFNYYIASTNYHAFISTSLRNCINGFTRTENIFISMYTYVGVNIDNGVNMNRC